jgi:hypothetical protein
MNPCPGPCVSASPSFQGGNLEELIIAARALPAGTCQIRCFFRSLIPEAIEMRRGAEAYDLPPVPSEPSWCPEDARDVFPPETDSAVCFPGALQDI